MTAFARCAAVTLIALAGFTACSKSSETTSTSSAAAASSAPSVAASTNGAEASDGGKVYQTNCSSCHQMNGQGVPGTFPPLAGNDVVVGDASKVIHIVKFGLTGKIAVAGASYNGMMPAWGQQMSNEDIAKAITYIRSAWGNKASSVTEADVAAAKQ